MTEWIAKLVEFAKLPTKWIAAAALGTGLLLVAPAAILQRLRLLDIVSTHGTYIGVAFLISSSILAIELVAWLWSIVRAKRKDARERSRAARALQSIDHKERAVLREFFLHGQNTLDLPATHPVVAGLLEKGLLEQVGTYGEHSLVGLLLPLTIPPESRELLTYDFLQLPEGQPSAEDKERIFAERPEFVRELQRRNARRYRWSM